MTDECAWCCQEPAVGTFALNPSIDTMELYSLLRNRAMDYPDNAPFIDKEEEIMYLHGQRQAHRATTHITIDESAKTLSIDDVINIVDTEIISLFRADTAVPVCDYCRTSIEQMAAEMEGNG